MKNIFERALQTHLVLAGHLCFSSVICWVRLSIVQLYQPLRSLKQYSPGGPSSQKVPYDTSRASTNRKRDIKTVSLGDIFLKKEIKFYKRKLTDFITLQQNWSRNSKADHTFIVICRICSIWLAVHLETSKSKECANQIEKDLIQSISASLHPRNPQKTDFALSNNRNVQFAQCTNCQKQPIEDNSIGNFDFTLEPKIGHVYIYDCMISCLDQTSLNWEI